MNLNYLLILISTFSSIVAYAESIENKKYVSPVPGEIVIMASTPIPFGINATVEQYEDVIECGFNVVTEGSTFAYYENQFSLIKNLDIKYLISYFILNQEQREEFIHKYGSSPSFGGWNFKDEPFYSELKELSNEYNSLYSKNGNKFIYLNLVGSLVKVFTGECKTYYQYLQKIQDYFHPSCWSYDLYPFTVLNGVIKVDYNLFYSNLEDIKKISKESQRPFWSFCQSMALKNNIVELPTASEPFLNFEAFNALAYGAQGIVYWTYGMRKSNDKENYISALVDLNGKKTPAWYAAKKVNQNIKKFNDVFYQCNVLEVRHTGDKLYKGTKKLAGEFGPFKMIRSGNAGVLVSHIKNNGFHYIVIVSHDVFNKQKISLELLANKNVTNLINGKNYNWRKDINLTLDKGGYVIFKVID